MILIKRISKTDIFLLSLLVILIVLTIIFIFYPNLGDFFNLSAHTDPEIANYSFLSGLFVVAIACFLGALVPFPVPYILIVAIVTSNFYNKGFNILSIIILIFIATFFNTLGDMLDYLVGLIGGKLKEDKESKNNKWNKIIYTKPKLIPIICFSFGLTPLPDSLLFIPLGIINYPLSKLLIWNSLGKFCMMSLVSIFGIFVFDLLFSLTGGSGGEHGWISGIITLYIAWIIMYFMLKK